MKTWSAIYFYCVSYKYHIQILLIFCCPENDYCPSHFKLNVGSASHPHIQLYGCVAALIKGNQQNNMLTLSTQCPMTSITFHL